MFNFDWIGDTITGIIEGIIQFLFNSFLGPFLGLDSLESLIFGRPESNGGESLVWLTFSQSDLSSGFVPIYNTMTALGASLFIISIVIAGMRITSSGYNPIRRNEAFQFTLELALVGLGFYYLPTLYDLLFTLNSGIVSYFDMYTNFETLTVDSDLQEHDLGILGSIFVQLVLLGLSFWASFYYMMRRITLLILMGMGPLMLAFWMIPQFKNMTGAWFRELTGSIFVQSIHSFVFFVVGVVSLSSTGLIPTVIVYIVFIPISESLRGLIGMGGDMQGGLAKAGSMMGMGAIAGMYGAVKGAAQEKSIMGAIKGASKGANTNKSEGNESGNRSGEDDKNSKAFADTQTGKMLGAGSFVSKLGKATLGAAGSVVGSPMGPTASILGAEIGSRIGAVAGVGGRVGAAAALGLANRIKQGKEAVKDLESKQGSEDEAMVNALSMKEMAGWAKENEEKVMNQLREDFPNATPEEIEKKFNDIKTQKLESFKDDARKQWISTKDVLANTGNGNALVASSAKSMAKQWANDNRDMFMKEYEEKNPRLEGESEEAFNSRKQQAFSERINSVQSEFMESGNKFVKMNGGQEGTVAKPALAKYMSSSAADVRGLGNINVSNLEQAAEIGMEDVSGVPLFNEGGKPNVRGIANGLASVRTEKEGRDFVESQVASGMERGQAVQMWQQQEKEVFEKNLELYKPNEITDALKTVRPMPNNLVQKAVQTTGAFTSGALNLKGWRDTLNVAGAGLTQGVEGAVAQHISQHDGDAVQAEHEFKRNFSYATAVAFGTTGLVKGQQIAAKLSPYNKHVQKQISSPSEVLSMAHTVTDDNGFEKTAKGAIRQVITRDSSYVEVRTNSGEVRTVSTIGAGNEKLRKGEVIYQDLTSPDGVTLTTTSIQTANGSTPFYRLDSGGGRIPVHNMSSENPLNLLGNPTHTAHAPVKRVEVPVLNQRVDEGNYYVEDLNKSKLDNLQVVIEKGKRFVTGQKEGITYRVSPIYEGDARLNSNQTVSVPVTISKGQLTPIEQTSSVSVLGQSVLQGQTKSKQSTVTQTIKLPNQHASTREVEQPNVQVLDNEIDSMPISYFSRNEISQLIESRHVHRANRIVKRRKDIDSIRKYQGFV